MTPAKRRSTRQRREILEILRATDKHPTALELHAVVRKRLPRVSLGTVYRNLEVLCEDGLARKLVLAGSDTRYDGLTHDHVHVRCTGCGALRDLPAARRDAEPDVPAEAEGFAIHGFRLEYFGVCAKCRTQDASPGDEGPGT